MSEKLKYPMQVGAVVRKTKTLGIDCALTLPTKDEYNKHKKMPLEMHSGFSRFMVTIIDRETIDPKTGVPQIAKANIPADEIAYIKNKTELAMEKIASMKSATTSNKSIAYTQKLFSKEYGGMTPAEVLIKTPEKKEGLINTRKWLQDNLTKYPRNKSQIDAIDDALALFEAGKLTAEETHEADTTITIYKEDIKIPRASKVDEDGNTFVYSISIVCMPGRNYPFAINIMNCYAPPIEDKTGSITVNLSAAKGTVKNSILLSEQEWFSRINRMNKTVENFENMHFEDQYKLAQENSYNYDEK